MNLRPRGFPYQETDDAVSHLATMMIVLDSQWCASQLSLWCWMFEFCAC